MSPPVDTVAAAPFELVQVIARPVNSPPTESRVTATACDVCAGCSAVCGAVTVTVAIGTNKTVIGAEPPTPSLVAVMFFVPGATAVTSPVTETVATVKSALVQVMVRPVNTLPSASRSTAVACVVCATNRAGAASVTTTLATGANVTVTAALPTMDSLVAVMSAEPGASVDTNPVAETVATVEFELVQVTARAVNTLSLASVSTAVACVFSPTKRLGFRSVTTTFATGTSVTVTVALPDFPSLVAVILAVPGARAVTNPVADTVATRASDVVHTTDRSVNTPPMESLVVAVACVVSPTYRAGAGSCTERLATGTNDTVTVPKPDLPSLVAVIRAAPTPTPVTTPPVDTVATEASDVVQITGRPVSKLPGASRTSTVACIV